MAMNVLWTRRAITHLEAELEYYGRINPALAKELSIVIKDSITNIFTLPSMGRPGKKMDTRELIINKYPYIMVYRVKNNVLEIVALIHQSRKNIKSFY
jgi:toxin ParE1/3/4